MLRPLFPYGKEVRYPLDRKLRERQSRSGRYGAIKNIFSLSEIETLFLGRQSCNIFTMPTELLLRGESEILHLFEGRYISQ
jgi:hypothetical protein